MNKGANLDQRSGGGNIERMSLRETATWRVRIYDGVVDRGCGSDEQRVCSR